MDRLPLILAVCISITVSGILSAKDDDFAYSRSLTENGYLWLAEKELQRLQKSPHAQDRMLSLYVLAVRYEKEGGSGPARYWRSQATGIEILRGKVESCALDTCPFW